MKKKLERLESNVFQHQGRITILEKNLNHLINRADLGNRNHYDLFDEDQHNNTVNTGDWTTFENIEIGDTIGGIKLTARTQIDILRSMGRALKVIEDYDHLGKVLNL